MRKNLPLISVILCSLNGADIIGDALKAIKSQKWAGKLEIIVVDDGSTDDTFNIAKSYKDVRVIRNKRNLGTAKSRNVGIKAAKGEIIAFTDDDCRPRPTWIKELYAGYKDEQVLGVAGEATSADHNSITLRYLHINNPLKPLENILLKSNGLAYRFGLYLRNLLGMGRKPSNNYRSVYAFATANASFRRTALDEIGFFDERFTFSGEDFDLCKRFNDLFPGSLWFAPKAIVDHKFEPTLRDTLRRSKAYGRGGSGSVSLKHEDIKPIIYPFPILILLSIFLGVVNPLLFLVPFILVLGIYSVGVRTALRTRNLEPLLYSYIQCLQELYHNVGFVEGIWNSRKVFQEESEAKTNIGRWDKNVSFIDSNFSIPKNTNSDIESKNGQGTRRDLTIVVLSLLLILLASRTGSITLLHFPAAFAAILLPGYLLIRRFGAERYHSLPVMLKLALSVSTGLAWLMFIGLFADLLLPHLGIKTPLTSNWLPILYSISTALLFPRSLDRVLLANYTLKVKLNRDVIIASCLVLLTVLLSFSGARILNNGGSNITVILAFLCGIVSIIFASARRHNLPSYVYPVVLFAISLASVWSYSLRSNYLFGSDIQQEFQTFQSTLQTGNWGLDTVHTSYKAMLSLTIFKMLAPVLFSFVPVILYYTYSLFAKKWIAYVAALVTVAQFYYMQEFSALVRQQIGFLFFASILYLILQNKLLKSTRNYLLILLIPGLVVSHYSTAYLAILLLVSTYILSRLAYFLLRRHRNLEAVTRNVYVSGWIVVLLVASAIIWYGPATHSSGILRKATESQSYSKIVQNSIKIEKKYFDTQTYSPKTSQAYLKTIGANDHKKYAKYHLKYYPGASNSSIRVAAQPTINAKAPLLETVSNAAQTSLGYIWWILGSLGIIAFILSTYRKFDYRKLELCVAGLSGIGAFIAVHVFPGLQRIYNVQRLDEQILMLVSLPAILCFLWLLQGIIKRYADIVLIGIVSIAFALASGIVTQFVGGNPPANLNNYGTDYNNFYVKQSELLSIAWLSQYSSHKLIYADTYGSLRLYSASRDLNNQSADVTPETISTGSFVLGDETNIVSELATTNVNGKNLSYTFPTKFLNTHKNLVYANGSSNVYR